MAAVTGRTPVLLLKTRSKPTDAYEELFAMSTDQGGFAPCFVPVLEHKFANKGLQELNKLLDAGRFGDAPDDYGGIIFTSQRAVEAFAQVVGDKDCTALNNIPLYSVGPATTRALRAVNQDPPLRIFGEHTGYGEKLAAYILDHFNEWYARDMPRPSLLFLVGEQRRDVIPKTLMDKNLPRDRQIQVDEIVIYESGVMESFKHDLEKALADTAGATSRWVVVFSPIGCGAMLQSLLLWDPEKRSSGSTEPAGDRNTFVATIGPTTATFLQSRFDFKPDVCSEQPSPEGLLKGITDFKASR
jgi:uroporphyrinogen-III synthase